MPNIDNTVNQLCRAYAKPIYWVLNEHLQILSYDTSSCCKLNVDSTADDSFPQFCLSTGLETPIQDVNFKKSSITLKDTIELHSDQKLQYFQCQSQFIDNGSRLVVVAFDITESIELEKNKVKVSFLQNIIDHVPYNLFWKDEKSTFLGCNKLFAKKAGLDNPDDIFGKTDYDLPWEKANSDIYRLDDQEVILSKKAKLNIEEAMFVDGKELFLLTSKVPLIKQGKVIGVIGIFHDITDRKNIENDLSKAKKIAEEAVKVKSNLLAIVSHELRTPLHGILGMTQMIQDQSYDDKVLGCNNDINILAMTLLNLVNDLLDFTQFERKQFILNQQPFSITSMTADLEKQLAQILPPTPNISFHYQIEPSIPALVIGDELRVRQVLNNLLSNAFKFTTEGGVTLSVKQKSSDPDTASIVFSIKDTGCGIPPSDQKNIFKNFFQIKHSNQSPNQGIGLGLAICEQIANTMNASITLVSDVGVGSEFSFTVDFPLPAEEHNLNHFTPTKNDYAAFHRHILLIEDDKINQTVMKYYLSLLSCTYDIASSAHEAISLLSANHHYDLIFLDIGLPDMNGIDLAKVIRGQPDQSDTPIIILTAQVIDPSNDMINPADINNVLIKPAEVGDIEQVLKKQFQEA